MSVETLPDGVRRALVTGQDGEPYGEVRVVQTSDDPEDLVWSAVGRGRLRAVSLALQFLAAVER